MRLPGIPCIIEKRRKRGYAEKIVERLRKYGLVEYAYGSYWTVIPSHTLLEISGLLPRCVYKNRQNNSPSVGDFIWLAKEYGQWNLYFVAMIKSLDIGDVEDFVIEAVYLPLENTDLIEWAKTFRPDSIGLVEYKGEYFVYCWWD
jgi:hypothetical protein